MGLVDELVDIDSVATRARVWLEQLLTLPRGPMLETRRIARMDLVAALEPERIELERFLEYRSPPHPQRTGERSVGEGRDSTFKSCVSAVYVKNKTTKEEY